MSEFARETRALIRMRNGIRRAKSECRNVALPEVVDTIAWLDKRILDEVQKRQMTK